MIHDKHKGSPIGLPLLFYTLKGVYEMLAVCSRLSSFGGIITVVLFTLLLYFICAGFAITESFQL